MLGFLRLHPFTQFYCSKLKVSGKIEVVYYLSGHHWKIS